MRILHVVRQFKPGIGGLEDYVANLAREQCKAGHKVTVLTLNLCFAQPRLRLPAFERYSEYDVVRIPYFGSRRYPVAWRVIGHLRDCDIVHVHAIDFFADFLAWTRRWHRRPMVLSTHGGFFHTSFAARLKWLYFHTVTRISLRAFKVVIASSVNDEALFSRTSARPVRLVENGVDLEKFAGGDRSKFCKRMVALGRFASHKRLDRILDFLAAVRRIDPQWTLTIIGAEWDVRARDLSEWTAERGLTESVSIKVSLNEAAVKEELSQASVIVSASEYEGFGIAVVEAMAAGLIPFVSGIPAFQHLLDQVQVGAILDFSDSEAAARKFFRTILLSVTKDYAESCSRMRRGVARFAWPEVAKEIESIYKEVLGTTQRTIFGVPVRVTTREDAVAQIDAEVTDHPVSVAFLNAHGANIARRNGAFSQCLQKSVVLNDGFGVDLASLWLYGQRFPENLNGTDFTIDYLARTRRSYSIYLLGARRRVVTQAAIRLGAKLSRHRIAGFHDGYFGSEDGDNIVADIRRSGADLLLVGLGNPAQELWIAEHIEQVGCRVAFAVGALFDFVSGSTPRAPLWVRQCRGEWLYRLMLEPRRLGGRYLVGNIWFLLGLWLGQADRLRNHPAEQSNHTVWSQ